MRRPTVTLSAFVVLLALVGVVPAGADQPAGDTICVVADPGGFENPFTGRALEGAEKAALRHQLEVASFTADTEAELAQVLSDLVEAESCDLLIGVGFLVGDIAEPLIGAYPDQLFSFIDHVFPVQFPNVASVQFRVDQASFLAGYLAAGISETGAVGVYGGMPFPPVTLFMDGYALGVEFYNDRYGTAVDVLGWDVDTQTGMFTYAFADSEAGYGATVELFEAGADTVFAVAGGTGMGSLTAAAEWKAAGHNVRVIEPDFDWYDLFGDEARVLLTSVLKDTGVAAFHQVEAFATGTWAAGPAWEDLVTDGVGLAKFHKTNDQVPDVLREDLKPLAAGISAGTIVTSPWFPLGPVGSAGHPVTVVLFSWEPPGDEAGILEDALRELTGLEVEVVMGPGPDTPMSYLCWLPDSTVGLLLTSQVMPAYDMCGADPTYKSVRFGSDVYWSQFVALRGSPYEELVDFDGATWAYSDQGSTSSYVVPRGMLNLEGVEVAGETGAGSHWEAIQAVYNGEVDFATTYFTPPITPGDPWEEGDPPDIPDEFVDDCVLTDGQLWCDGFRVLDPRQNLARELGAADVVERVEIVMVSPGIPNDGLSFGGAMPADVRALVQAAFEEMADEGSDYYQDFMDSFGLLYTWQGLSQADISEYEWISQVFWAAGE